MRSITGRKVIYGGECDVPWGVRRISVNGMEIMSAIIMQWPGKNVQN